LKKIKKIKENKRLQSFSITKRLTILSTLFSFLILFLSTGFLYWTLKDNLEKKDAKFLIEEIFELKSILLENSYDWAIIEKKIKGEEAINYKLKTKYYRRILDEEGYPCLETTGMGEMISPHIFPEPEEIDYSDRGKKWQSKDRKTFLLMATQVENPQKSKYVLQLAVDISQDENLITDYRGKIAWIFIVGILFSIGTNIAVARNGMRPLKEITKKAHRITASQLHERIHPEHWPKELNALANAFDEMLDRLEDSFNRLSQFSMNLAHELRTPINNLMGEAQVAISKVRTPQEYLQVLESSLEEYSRISRMIDNLLFLARSENKEIRLELVYFDVRQEIEAVVEFYEAVAQEQGVKVLCHGMGFLKADITLFRRMINNLLSNSLQYTPKGGIVTISIQQLEKQLHITVNDTGIGIDPKDLPYIFNRFFRAQSARLQYPQGMGLGLYMVKSIMNLHNGTVELESTPAQGTIVTLKFSIPETSTPTNSFLYVDSSKFKEINIQKQNFRGTREITEM